MQYDCISRQEFRDGPYTIVPLREEDMAAIKEWRNAQLDVLRQAAPLSDEDQKTYWRDVLMPSFKEEAPSQILFSFLKEGHCFGYGGLTHIDWQARRAEVSFLLEPSRTKDPARYKQEFKAFLKLLRQAAFEELRFHRLYTETFDVRPAHVEALEAFGFSPEGVLKDHALVKGKYCDSLIHGLVNNE